MSDLETFDKGAQATPASNRKWEVIYTRWTMYAGMGTGEENSEYGERTHHRTYFGADLHRRFRFRGYTMGMRGFTTCIVRTADEVAWSNELEPSRPPRYAAILDRVVWPIAYFLRSRWDGLRYGLDRDARR